MSQYLKQKILRRIQEAKENIDIECDGIRESAVESGISHLVSNIPDLNYKDVKAPSVEKPVHNPRYINTELAEVAIDIYKTNINPKEEEVVQESPQPVASTKKHDMKAIAKSLTGMRTSSGDSGKIGIAAGPNGGDAGNYTPEASEFGGNSTNNVDNYHALTTSMSLEEYEMHIKDSWGIIEQVEEVEEEEVLEYIDESSAVTELEDQLLQLENTTWQSIDRVMRSIAKEHGITPKQLHKDFKSAHGGQIPDDWIKEQVVEEECGWYPLEEARIQKNGMVYEVSMIWKGSTHRLKFFWPEMKMPSRNEMVRASEMFYPGSRLLAYYPSEDEGGNFMVLVPPLTEHFVVNTPDDWVTLSSEDQETYEMICEEVGEPIDVPQQMDDGSFEVIVEDHDTGKLRTVVFGEGKRGLWDNIHDKRKRGEKPAKPGDKDYPKTLNVEDKDPCWDGYKRKKGTKKFAPGSCVKEDMSGMSQKSGDKRSTDSGAGMTAKGVAKYNRRTGGNLKTAVTTPPSKLKAGSKAANRRKSFCARSRGWNGERGKAARRRWNC